MTAPGGGAPLTVTAAAGQNDRATGSVVSVDSKYPSGSADKAFTSTACMALAERGALQLDRPVHEVIDPWHARQGVPSLKSIFGGDARIEQVTARMLMGMRSGLPDYNDKALRDWTFANPSQDWQPMAFIRDWSGAAAGASAGASADTAVGADPPTAPVSARTSRRTARAGSSRRATAAATPGTGT